MEEETLGNNPSISTKLLEIRDIIEFSVDYMMLNLHQINDEHTQQTIYVICCNLHRAKYRVEMELIDLGITAKLQVFNPHSIKQVSYFDINIREVIKQVIEQKKDNNKTDYLRRWL